MTYIVTGSFVRTKRLSDLTTIKWVAHQQYVVQIIVVIFLLGLRFVS